MAQRQPATATAAPPVKLAPFSFDSTGNRIPLPVKVVRPTDLVRALTLKPKGEFESTEEFRARTNAGTPRGPFAVRVPIQASGEDRCAASASYDADSGTMRVDIPMHDIIDPADIGVPVSCLEIPQGSYVGRNGFGVKITVRQSRRDVIAIAADSFPSYGARLTFAMARAEAARRKPFLALLLLATPQIHGDSAVMSADATRYTPKIDSPTDVSVYTTFVWSDNPTFIVYDSRTGEVLYRGVVPPRRY